MKRALSWAWLVVVGVGYESSSCAPAPFADASLISSVRILATTSEPPYATPGDPVRVRVLAHDGRANQPAPMNIFWLPLVCTDPANDAYYSCFQQFAAIAGGAADAGAGRSRPMGAVATVTLCDGGTAGSTSNDSGGAPIGPPSAGDLTPFVTQGDCASFVMPPDIIPDAGAAPSLCASSPPVRTPYGLAILFNIACAGHLELVPQDPANVQSPPIGCFDDQHNRLGPEDYVFGFTRVYAYDKLQNANPVIESIEVEGNTVNLDPDAGTDAGFEVDHCASGASCRHWHIGPVVPASSQELNPIVCDVHQNPLKEQIWAEFYATLGSFTNDARLLYDPATGSVGSTADTDTQYEPPDHPGNGTIWIIVHDNRGGATWAAVPVRVR